MSCGDDHDWEDVQEKFAPEGGSSLVVRWCCMCGAIRVDNCYDGRTNKGEVKVPVFTDPIRGLDE